MVKKMELETGGCVRGPILTSSVPSFLGVPSLHTHHEAAARGAAFFASDYWRTLLALTLNSKP